MKTLILILALAAVGLGQSFQTRLETFDKPKDFKVEYDKFKDTTRVAMTKGKSWHTKKSKAGMDEIDVRAEFTAPGQSLEKNIDKFWLIFEGGGSEWTFLNNRSLIFLLDGEQLDLGDGEHDGSVRLGGVDERVVFSVDRSEFEQIINAKNIEMQLGSFEGTINNRTLYRTLSKLKGLFDLGTVQK